MIDYLRQLFSDEKIIKKVREKLPYLFQIAELECSRAGKIGMQVGSLRESIISALLMYKFGEENIEAEIPITQSETDVILYDKPVSIKTISGNLSGVKLIWTVDAKSAFEFSEKYYPSIDMLLAQTNWGGVGSFYYFPTISQIRIFEKIGRNQYIKLPKEGTNPRGVEMSKLALTELVKDKATMKIEIKWDKVKIDYDAYDRWIELWRE